jgi:hypothetical protein
VTGPRPWLRLLYVESFSAEEALIQRAQQRAMAENTTLNELFRAWLGRYVAQDTAVDRYEALLERLEHVEADGKFTRDALNARD